MTTILTDPSTPTPSAGLWTVGDVVHQPWCKHAEHDRRIAAERRTHGDAAGWTGCVSRVYRAKAGRYTVTGSLLDVDPDAAPSVCVEIIRDGKLAYCAMPLTFDELQAVGTFLGQLAALAAGQE